MFPINGGVLDDPGAPPCLLPPLVVQSLDEERTIMSISLSIGHTPNYASLRLGNVRLEFSYETVIAFDAGDGLVIRQNDWGPTTGKHLNALDGGGREAKARRLSSDEFRMRLAAVTDRIDAALEHA